MHLADGLLVARVNRGRERLKQTCVWWERKKKMPWTEPDGETSLNVKPPARETSDAKRRKQAKLLHTTTVKIMLS